MRKTIILLTVLLTSHCLMAQNNLPEAKVGQIYGAEFKEKGAKPIKDLPSMLSKKDKINAKITAKVIDVCPKKGCWMNLAINDSTTAFVKMKDYGFFVPMNLEGKTIVIDGTAYTETTSVEELRHYAEDAKKTKEEIEAITEPQLSYRITANGIKIID